MNSEPDAFDEQEFANLIDRLREGSDEAFTLLLERFGPYVMRSVRRSLDRRLRARFDSQDFAQAVWMTATNERV